MSNIGRYKTIENSFRQKCLAAKVNYKLALAYRTKHKNLTDEEVIAYYKQKSQEEKINKSEKFRQYGINPCTGLYYMNNHPELTIDQVIEHYTQEKKTLTQRLKEANISVSTYRRVKDRNNWLSEDELIELCVKQKEERKYKEENGLRSLCEKHGLKIKNVFSYKYSHPELSDSEIVRDCLELQKKLNEKTLKQLLEENNISKSTYRNEQNKHRELSREQIIEICKQKPKVEKLETSDGISFKEKCKTFEVNYKNALEFRRNHPELSDNQIIMIYNKKVYENILGELILI